MVKGYARPTLTLQTPCAPETVAPPKPGSVPVSVPEAVGPWWRQPRPRYPYPRDSSAGPRIIRVQGQAAALGSIQDNVRARRDGWEGRGPSGDAADLAYTCLRDFDFCCSGRLARHAPDLISLYMCACVCGVGVRVMITIDMNSEL